MKRYRYDYKHHRLVLLAPGYEELSLDPRCVERAWRRDSPKHPWKPIENPMEDQIKKLSDEALKNISVLLEEFASHLEPYVISVPDSKEMRDIAENELKVGISGPTIDFAVGLVRNIQTLLREGSLFPLAPQLHRNLGFIQGVLWTQGLLTFDQLQEMTKSVFTDLETVLTIEAQGEGGDNDDEPDADGNEEGEEEENPSEDSEGRGEKS